MTKPSKRGGKRIGAGGKPQFHDPFHVRHREANKRYYYKIKLSREIPDNELERKLIAKFKEKGWD